MPCPYTGIVKAKSMPKANVPTDSAESEFLGFTVCSSDSCCSSDLEKCQRHLRQGLGKVRLNYLLTTCLGGQVMSPKGGISRPESFRIYTSSTQMARAYLR